MNRGRKSTKIWVILGIIVFVIVATIGILFVTKKLTNKDTEKQESNQDPVVEEIKKELETNVEDPQVPIVEEQNKEEQTETELDIANVIKGENENSQLTMGIDVSKWQGKIDWEQVAAAGVEFAMIRVGYRTVDTGVIVEDVMAKYNLQEAEAAGIKIGAYFFSTAITKEEAVEEADWVTALITPYAITYPVAYNCEGFSSENSRQNTLTTTERTDLAIAFLDRINEKGYTPMFYASKTELQANKDWETYRISKSYKIWVSQYPNQPYPTTEKSSYTGVHAMWQHSSQGVVPGIPMKADLNIAYFGYDTTTEAVDDSDKVKVDANVGDLMSFTDVNEQVTAKSETNLRTEPSTTSQTSTVKTVLKNGVTAKRIGINDSTGWSKLEYNGMTLYAVSNFLTTDLNYHEVVAPEPTTDVIEEVVDGVVIRTTFTAVSDTVTAKELVNLRSLPSVTNEKVKVVGELTKGETLTRTGVSDNGWSRLECNGQTVYAITSYLKVEE